MAVLFLNAAEFLHHRCQRFIPHNAGQFSSFVAQEWITGAIGGLKRVVFGKTFRAKLSVIHRMVRVPAHAHRVAVFHSDEHPAAHRAISTCGGNPFVRNLLLGGMAHDRVIGVSVLLFHDVQAELAF